MAAPEERRLFPPQPYYIPGYEGFVPQYKYRFGESFGKTTNHLLTDPSVRKSPRSVLVPLHGQKFAEDTGGMKHNIQGYVPGHPGYFPYETYGAATISPDPVLEPKPSAAGPGLAEEQLMRMDTDPTPWHCPGEYAPRPRLPRGYLPRISHHPASEEQEWQLPELTPAYGQGRSYGPGQLGSAWGGSKLPVQFEDVTVPGVVETAAVMHNWLPKLDVPNAIEQKVIPGYSGYIPRLTWTNGVNYNQGVKEAMEEFNEYQFLQRHPVCRLGKRYPQTYWPTNQIYTSAGLIPAYRGFVPYLRHIYALTFGNSTRKAYEKEQKSRVCAQ